MYPVESKVLIKDEERFLCHVYTINNEWFAVVDVISEQGSREWESGKGNTQDQAIYDAINKIYERRNYNNS